MQITLNLPDELLKQLLSTPDPEHFAQQAIAAALRRVVSEPAVNRHDSDTENLSPESEDPLEKIIGIGHGTGEAVGRHHNRWLYGDHAK